MAPATVAKLNDAIGQVLKTQKLREEYRQGGAEAQPSSPEQFAAIVKDTYSQWGRMLAKIGFTKL